MVNTESSLGIALIVFSIEKPRWQILSDKRGLGIIGEDLCKQETVHCHNGQRRLDRSGPSPDRRDFQF